MVPCAHNPIGVHPTNEKWKEISYQFKVYMGATLFVFVITHRIPLLWLSYQCIYVKCGQVKNHYPLFDMAYQGFACGDTVFSADSFKYMIVTDLGLMSL